MIKVFYQKDGQITPFMLVIIVILIMAVMVTVNIGKISLTKTHSSNAADAGSLAGASVMANVFNMLADANITMIERYDIFRATVTAGIAWAGGELVVIHLAASKGIVQAGAASFTTCLSSCSAAAMAAAAEAAVNSAIVGLGGWRSGFIGTINSIATEVTAYYLLQWNFYNEVRDAALEGHTSAVRLSFQLAFSNSGISEKLISGSPPPEPERRGNLNNYQVCFSNFVEQFRDGGIARNPAFSSLNYPWRDGQNRAHQVDVDVTLDPPERYEVRVTLAPYLVEMANLALIETLAYWAIASLDVAGLAYSAAAAHFSAACVLVPCCLTCHGGARRAACAAMTEECISAHAALTGGIAANSAAISGIIAIYPLLVLAEAGVATTRPGGDPPWKGEVTPFGFIEPDILAWIENVGPRDEHPHNGMVRVDTTQSHQGIDYTLWRMQYPMITSFSQSNFRYDRFDNYNSGRIYEPDTRHEATIVRTD